MYFFFKKNNRDQKEKSKNYSFDRRLLSETNAQAVATSTHWTRLVANRYGRGLDTSGGARRVASGGRRAAALHSRRGHVVVVVVDGGGVVIQLYNNKSTKHTV